MPYIRFHTHILTPYRCGVKYLKACLPRDTRIFSHPTYRFRTHDLTLYIPFPHTNFHTLQLWRNFFEISFAARRTHNLTIYMPLPQTYFSRPIYIATHIFAHPTVMAQIFCRLVCRATHTYCQHPTYRFHRHDLTPCTHFHAYILTPYSCGAKSLKSCLLRAKSKTKRKCSTAPFGRKSTQRCVGCENLCGAMWCVGCKNLCVVKFGNIAQHLSAASQGSGV